MTDTLKPCPFCGGKARDGGYDDEWELHPIFCVSCNARIWGNDLSEAITAWNTRPTASNLPADSNLQKTQIAPDVVEEVREALANLISVAERNIYPQPDKVNSDYAKLVSAKSALTKLSAMPSGEPAPDVVAALNDTQWQINVVEGCIRKENPKMADRLLELFGRNHAVLSRLSSMPSGWRPIKSAPRDGSTILLFHSVHGVIQGWYAQGEWSEDTPVSPREYSGPVWILGDDLWQSEVEELPDGYYDGPITHWQPYPTPPEGEK